MYLAIENRRADFLQMLTHHLATIVLVGMSYCWNYWRVGLVVLLLHDVVDIFLYLTKASKEMTFCPRQVTEALFVIFAVSFFVLRLVIFPTVCVWPAARCGMHDIFDNLDFFFGILEPWPTDAVMMQAGVGLYSMPILLGVLQVLHVFWFVLIVRIIVKTVAKAQSVTETGDIRSDESDCSPVSASRSPIPKHSPPPEPAGAMFKGVPLKGDVAQTMAYASSSNCSTSASDSDGVGSTSGGNIASRSPGVPGSAVMTRKGLQGGGGQRGSPKVRANTAGETKEKLQEAAGKGITAKLQEAGILRDEKKAR